MKISLLSAMLLPLLVARIGAAPHPSPIVHSRTPSFPHISNSTEASTTEPGYAVDGMNNTSRILSSNPRTFSICGADINAPPYDSWTAGAEKYRPYFDYTYRFQDQRGTRTWQWHLSSDRTGVVNHRYETEHIYELQLIGWFFDDYLLKRPEVIDASPETDPKKQYTWFCRFHVVPKIINSKDWTTANSFNPFYTPAAMLSAQLSGAAKPKELVYLVDDLNSVKAIFFGLKIPYDKNHLENILADLARVSLLAEYLNEERVWRSFGHVSKRMDKFYGSNVQTAVTKSQWTLGKKIPWEECYEDFESRFLAAIQRNMRAYRDRQINRAKEEIKKREKTTGSSMKWLLDQIKEYQEARGPLSDEVFSLQKLWAARNDINNT